MAVVLKEGLAFCNVVRIIHIGSKVIKSIWAKPIVHILVEIAPDEDICAISEIMKTCGFIKMFSSEKRVPFDFGYTPNGFADKVYHLHLRFNGDNNELYFRDYLNERPDVAKEYEYIKLNLWHKYGHDRDTYTVAKTEFVDKYTRAVKNLYGNRYEQRPSCLGDCEH